MEAGFREGGDRGLRSHLPVIAQRHSPAVAVAHVLGLWRRYPLPAAAAPPPPPPQQLVCDPASPEEGGHITLRVS